MFWLLTVSLQTLATQTDSPYHFFIPDLYVEACTKAYTAIIHYFHPTISKNRLQSKLIVVKCYVSIKMKQVSLSYLSSDKFRFPVDFQRLLLHISNLLLLWQGSQYMTIIKKIVWLYNLQFIDKTRMQNFIDRLFIRFILYEKVLGFIGVKKLKCHITNHTKTNVTKLVFSLRKYKL